MSTITFPKGPLPPEYFTADRSSVLLGVAVAFIVIDVFAFALRVIAERIRGKRLQWEDTFIILALLCNIGLFTEYILTLQYGAGKHTLAAVKADPNWLTVTQKPLAILTLIVAGITYTLAVLFSKLAIMSLYLQIFKFGPARYMSYIVIGVTLLHCVVGIVVILMQCIPLSLVWSSHIRDTCIDVKLFYRYTAIPNVATDFVMLVMPLPQVWQLRAPTRVKVAVSLTILTGSLGILCSILRLIEVTRVDPFSDPLWLIVNLGAYSMAEPGTIFLAACLVKCRPLLRYVTESGFDRHFRARPDSRDDLEAKRPIDAAENRHNSVPEKKKQVRAFDSILLSAISKNTTISGTETKNGSSLSTLAER